MNKKSKSNPIFSCVQSFSKTIVLLQVTQIFRFPTPKKPPSPEIRQNQSNFCEHPQGVFGYHRGSCGGVEGFSEPNDPDISIPHPKKPPQPKFRQN